jgi:hypothetical protein
MIASICCRPRPNSSRCTAGLITVVGYTASLLAVWCQVVLLAITSIASIAVGAVDPVGSAPVCRARDEGQPPDPKPARSGHECALCVLCLTNTPPLTHLTPGPTFPDRHVVIIRRLTAAYPRAPPLRLIAASQPRGPPTLI